MSKFCPICGIVLLDGSGVCPSCAQQFDAGALPVPTKFEVQRSLIHLRRIQGIRNSGGASAGIAAKLVGSMLCLISLGLIGAIFTKVDYRLQPQIAGVLGAIAVLTAIVGTRFMKSGPATDVEDKLAKTLDVGAQATRLEALHKELAAK